MISLKVILKEIAAQKVRLFLAIFSVAFGTASIAFMLSIGEGLRLSFMKMVSGGNQLTLAMQPGYTTKNYKGMPEQIQVRFNVKDTKELVKIPHVQQVIPIVSFAAATRAGKRIAYSSPLATTPSYEKILLIKTKPGGRFINYLDMKQTKKVAFIGDQVAKWLFPSLENPVGMTFNLGGQVFHVTGVAEPSMGFGSYNGSVSNQVIIPLSTYSLLTDNYQATQFILLLDPGTELKKTEEAILGLYAKWQGFSPKDNEAIFFSDSASGAKTLNTFLTGFQIFLGIIGGMTLFVSGVGIANIMFISIKRASRIIGTQMAIGATYATILFHYFFESMLITFSGGLLGILATLSLVELLDMIPIRNKQYIELGSPRPILSWGVLIAVIAVLGVIGFFSAFFPARKAARIQPAAALREEG